MNLDEIKELMDALLERDIVEFELERDDEKIRIRRSDPNAAVERSPYVIVSPAMAGHEATSLPAANTAPSASNSKQTAVASGPPPEQETDADLTKVPSPIVGTFYESSSPDAEPFVALGDRVEVGQVLCIIEAMKLMNEIEAEVAGIVEKRFVSNGQPVEYGEALFGIRAN
ncbi:MAG: acetyl-CoA carboxylase biotin carboxyl carrier protein [Acidobacteria bacterium]|nr:acetyl-CoA carboxylase biotin carboxyl carrier protein [Acidobacteriota bacterium]